MVFCSLFQFQNGTIKRKYRIWRSSAGILFQFQNGTIKSDTAGNAYGLLDAFQFQNGTIKSALRQYITGWWTCFNSKMVRLKGDNTMVGRMASYRFQFQNGTIKSVSPVSNSSGSSYGFNSKMVRLKAVQKYRKKCLFSRLSAFIFHSFQLKLSSTSDSTKIPGVRQGAKLFIFKMSKNASLICLTQKCKIILCRQL